MLNRKLNEARITFDLKTTSPLLIKQGESEDETQKRQRQFNQGTEHTLRGADMIFIHLGKEAEQNQFYIPGSSIKGVVRSWCEKITRTLVANKCCDPFEDKRAEMLSCSEKFSRLVGQAARGARQTLEDYRKKENLSEQLSLDGRLAYHFACPICKLFGCTVLASRLKVSDAFLLGFLPKNLVKRDAVAIDRFTGGVKEGAKFDYQALQGVSFRVAIAIQNFELWQLGLLGFFFRDLQQGEVSFGYGKTRGLGGVICEKLTVELSYIGASANVESSRAYGIGALLNDDELAKNYGLVTNDFVTGLPSPQSISQPTTGLSRLYKTFTYKAQEGKSSLNHFFAILSQTWVGQSEEAPSYIDLYNTEQEAGDETMLKARRELMSGRNFITQADKSEADKGLNGDAAEAGDGKD